MYGLALEGGGARGAYHIGAWKAFRELGLEIGAVAGTSIGALNGALLVQDKFDEAIDLWHTITPEMVVQDDTNMFKKLFNQQIKLDEFDDLIKYIKRVMKDKGVDTTPFENLMKEVIDEEAVRKASIEFGLVTISITDMKPLEVFIDEIPEGRLHDYLMASASFPGFKMQKIDGKNYLDGGLHDLLPINMVAEKGFDDIIAVGCSGVGIRRKVKSNDVRVTYITPSGDTGSLFEFNPEQTAENIKMGYYDTMRAFKRWNGSQYYLDGSIDEERYIENLSNLSEEAINSIAKTLGIKEGKSKRLLFETIIPTVAGLLKLPETAGYEEIVMGVFEAAANYLGVDRYQVFMLDDFFRLVENKVLELDINDIYSEDTMFSSIMRKSKIYMRTNSDELLFELFCKLVWSLKGQE